MSKENKVTFDLIRANCGWKGADLLLVATPDESWDNPEYITNPFYPYSRLMAYQPYRSYIWSELEFDKFITAISFLYKDHKKRLCVLSAEGDFFIRKDPDNIIEKIPGAGIESENSGNGRLFGMSVINNHVYAYGEARQIYRRSDDGQWSMLDESLLQPVDTPIAEVAIIYDAKCLSEDEIYFIDDIGTIMLWNGSVMRIIQKIPDTRLVSMVIEDENTVWIGGSNGTLLKGNHRDGFKQVPGIDGTHNFVSMTRFKGKLYLGSHGGGWDVGAYLYHDDRLSRLQTGLTPETKYDAHTVTSTDDDLWVVGLKDILHFDGKAWERIDFPGNPPIR